jgi:hypothetical protein
MPDDILEKISLPSIDSISWIEVKSASVVNPVTGFNAFNPIAHADMRSDSNGKAFSNACDQQSVSNNADATSELQLAPDSYRNELRVEYGSEELGAHLAKDMGDLPFTLHFEHIPVSA